MWHTTHIKLLNYGYYKRHTRQQDMINRKSLREYGDDDGIGTENI